MDSDVKSYPYEVLTTKDIVKHVVDCIKEVNTVLEVRAIVKVFLCRLIQISF